MAWTLEIYQSRIADSGSRVRHAAGSPSPDEIAAYQDAPGPGCPRGSALVLGMTPELRLMAATCFEKVHAVDASEIAIGIFSDWLPAELREKETTVHGRWDALAELLPAPVNTVFGDGILGNLGDFDGAVATMKAIRSVLAPEGRLVMRNIIVPEDVATGPYDFPRLLEDFRAGAIDAAEFGFTARVLGFHDSAYDAATSLLDNARVYARLDAMARNLSPEENAAIARYRFLGSNYFPARAELNRLMEQAGFSAASEHAVVEKLWHRYYPVQSFAPV